MPQLITMLPTIGKVGQAGTGILGMISNLIRARRIDEAQKAAIQNQRNIQALTNNPALLAQKVAAAEQPLNQGLVAGVENQAQAGLAERGLGTSPQIANEVFAQALGPYEQENRMAALRSILQLYGMDNESINTVIGAEGKPIDTSGLWQMLQGKPNIPTLPPEASQIATLDNINPQSPGLDIPGYTSPNPLPSLFPDSGGGNIPGTDDLWGGFEY